ICFLVQAEDGIRDFHVTGVQTCALPICRRFRRHNAARRWVEGEVWSAMAATWRGDEVSTRDVRNDLRGLPEVRAALDRLWPVLTDPKSCVYGHRILQRVWRVFN